VDGHNLLSFVLEVVLIFRVKGSDNIFGLYMHRSVPFYSSKMNNFFAPPDIPIILLPFDSSIIISPPLDSSLAIMISPY